LKEIKNKSAIGMAALCLCLCLPYKVKVTEKCKISIQQPAFMPFMPTVTVTLPPDNIS
jgi:hypothetical protein